jgi:hypothetical protein
VANIKRKGEGGRGRVGEICLRGFKRVEKVSDSKTARQ